MSNSPILTIAQGVDAVTFVNVWTTTGADEQRRLVEAMCADASPLARKPGFVSMAILRSTDGEQVVVLAQWASQHAFDAAITDDDAMAGRTRLEQHGQSSAHLHAIAAIYGPERVR